MGERTGLDAVSVAVLESLDAIGARPDRPTKKSRRVVDHLYEEHGIPPRLAYEAICTNVASWLLQVPLLDFNGEMGGPDDQPAACSYTEVRLSPAGALALASERGEAPRLPIGLINGDVAFHGSRPPFDPARVIEALRLAGAGAASDDELVETIGPPSFPMGCPVTGDFAALAAGTSTMLSLGSEIAIETGDRGPRLVISRVPFGVGSGEVTSAIACQIRFANVRRNKQIGEKYPALESALDLPLSDVIDESPSRLEPRVVCELSPGAAAESCRQRLLQMGPLTRSMMSRLSAPLATLVRNLVDEPVAQNAALTELLRALP